MYGENCAINITLKILGGLEPVLPDEFELVGCSIFYFLRGEGKYVHPHMFLWPST